MYYKRIYQEKFLYNGKLIIITKIYETILNNYNQIEITFAILMGFY